MRIKASLQNKFTKSFVSLDRRNSKRKKTERDRRNRELPHVVEYFHEATDPYSHLMVQLLPEFARRYDVQIKVNIVGPPPEWAAPDRERLEEYAILDAQRLARRAQLSFHANGGKLSASRINEANAALVSAVDDGTFFDKARAIGDRLWYDAPSKVSTLPSDAVARVLTKSSEKRDRLGHYLGATLFYGGEWYWGPDRLHYLETRLRELGARRASTPSELLFEPPVVPSGRLIPTGAKKPKLHWYLSFRSPYTGIVGERVKALADAYGAELRLRFVLPMVMRGMPVPRKKGFYIITDVAREADRHGIPFGDVFDPVGRPVERGYSILTEAINKGRGFEFVQSFLSGVWRDGLDAGSDKGLKEICERAGLSWNDVKALVGGDHWRSEAEANRQEMFDYGVWGVPSFRVGEVTTWGQDRLWVIEDALRSFANA